jgi:DNA-binding HxlR family transcriptional regulator
MAVKRTYGDRCGIARALDAVGERWALLVVRELLLGPKRFTDLRAGLPNVGPDMLALRLRELADAGIVARRRLPPPAGTRVYELTGRGRELEDVILALARWGRGQPFPDGAELGPDAAMIALKTVFGAADGLTARVEIRLGEDVYDARVAGGRFTVVRGVPETADAVLATTPGTLAEILWRGAPLTEATVEGDRDLLERFLALFSARPAAP